jgi:23S rRNA (guanine745-N1)-methyltransferase
MLLIQCPVCQHAMKKVDRIFQCANNHHFDQSKYGHVNLLLSHKKHSKLPGDSSQMVMARQSILNSGIYTPISDALNSTIQNIYSGTPLNITDIGCGEGFYTDRLNQYLQQHDIKNTLYGLDISKDAIVSAAKRNKDIVWLIASAIDMPIISNSMDVAVCLFTRLMPDSFKRIIKDNGYLVTVTTGQKHLIELREIIYPKIKDNWYDPTVDLQTHFTLYDHQSIMFQTELKGSENIKNLLLMTPHHWKVNQQGRDKIQSINKLGITVDVHLNIYKPTDNTSM